MNILKRIFKSKKKPAAIHVAMDKSANDWFLMNPGNPVATIERCLYCGVYHLHRDAHVCKEVKPCKKS